MAVAQSPQSALVETIGKHRSDADAIELVKGVKAFWRENQPLLGLKDGCETAVYYDRLQCELKVMPLTADPLEAASRTETKWVGQPASVREYAAAREEWDWLNPQL